MGKIIAITSGKGGLGKSTLCVGVGLALADLGKRVIVSDVCDTLGTIGEMLGLSSDIVYDKSDVVCGNCKLKDAMYASSHSENLLFLPSSQNLENKLSFSVQRQLILFLSELYDYVVLDLSIDFDNPQNELISCVDMAIVLSNLNSISLRAAQQSKSVLKDNGVKNIRLVLNSFSAKVFKGQNSYNDLDEVIDDAGIQLIAIIPEDKESAVKLLNNENINANSRLYNSFKRLAQRIEGKDIPLLLKTNIL